MSGSPDTAPTLLTLVSADTGLTLARHWPDTSDTSDTPTHQGSRGGAVVINLSHAYTDITTGGLHGISWGEKQLSAMWAREAGMAAQSRLTLGWLFWR